MVTPRNPKSPRALKKAATIAQNLEAVSKNASEVLAAGHYGRKLTDEMLEAILVRVSAGDTVKHVCETLGVGSGLVYQKAYRDKEFGAMLKEAQELGEHTRVDAMTEVALDQSRSVEERRLITDIIWKVAKTRNRDAYGDKPLVNMDKVIINLSGDDMSRI